MSGSLKISSIGAFSQAWNRGIDSNASFSDKLRCSIKAFMKALIFGYEVFEADVDKAFLTNGSHVNSIFGKECCKLRGRNLTSVSAREPVSKQVDTKKKTNNYSREKRLRNKKKNATERPSRVNAKSVSVNDLKKLMCAKEFNINDYHFSTERLNLLETKDCCRLLKRACELKKGDLALRLLLAKDCSLSGDYKKSLLFLFVANGITDGVRFLLEKDTEKLVNCRNKINVTLLMVAAECGHLECLNLLMEAGADVNGTDNIGRTPLHWAASTGRVQCLNALLKKGAKMCATETGMTALCYAAEMGDLACIKALLQEKGVSLKGVRGAMGPLAIVVSKGDAYLECFNALQAFDMEASKERDGRGCTPLYYAILGDGSAKIFDQLLKVDGIDVNVVDYLGRTLLMLAIQCKRKEYFVALLRHNDIDVDKVAKIEHCETHEYGVIHWIVEENDTTYLKGLLAKGIDINVQNDNGETPLQYAMSCGAFSCFDMLLREKNIGFHLTDNNKNTLLHCAVKKKECCGKFLSALLSVENGIQNYVNNQNNDGDTALHIAVKNGDTESIKNLLTIKDIGISIKAGQGDLTPLGLAKQLGNEECAKLLWEYNAAKNGDKE